ncbi:hypothetical protein GQ55_5G329000 [Panicum hallii var. hallii]|uniref:Uncharacterized protein n=1 Tax=Panicum hallii var. hallii TaxID=1504633 RepID=A0A2T7DLV4_9POAL|nr:hypothetical protein GQ55_5G329000 [Panicum hallii var. hallii]
MGGDGLYRLAGRSGLGRLNLRVETGRSGLEWFFVDFVRRGDLALAFAAEAGFACAIVTADAAVSTASLEMAPASASMTSNLKTMASAARAPRSLRPRALRPARAPHESKQLHGPMGRTPPQLAARRRRRSCCLCENGYLLSSTATTTASGPWRSCSTRRFAGTGNDAPRLRSSPGRSGVVAALLSHSRVHCHRRCRRCAGGGSV